MSYRKRRSVRTSHSFLFKSEDKLQGNLESTSRRELQGVPYVGSSSSSANVVHVFNNLIAYALIITFTEPRRFYMLQYKVRPRLRRVRLEEGTRRDDLSYEQGPGPGTRREGVNE